MQTGKQKCKSNDKNNDQNTSRSTAFQSVTPLNCRDGHPHAPAAETSVISWFPSFWNHQWLWTHGSFQASRAPELSPHRSFLTLAHPAPGSSLNPTSTQSSNLGTGSCLCTHAGGQSRTKRLRKRGFTLSEGL